ncbi:hypothetical protein EDD85DRAFT_310894 [Armillaria nabsnona]|nr:hypothetical protein EDD85DRAFT_310894 [Armillaria nabsnona]
MSTTCSLSRIYRHSRTQYFLQFLLFCFAIAAVLGAYRSNPIHVTVFGIFAAIVGLVAVVQGRGVAKGLPAQSWDLEEVDSGSCAIPNHPVQMLRVVDSMGRQVAVMEPVQTDSMQVTLSQWRPTGCRHISCPDDDESSGADEPYECNVCRVEKYYSIQSFRNHCRRKGHAYCSKCTRSFVDEGARSQHFQNAEAHRGDSGYDRDSYECDVCDAEFSSLRLFRDHCHRKGHGFCADCKRSFIDKHARDQHLANAAVHGDDIDLSTDSSDSEDEDFELQCNVCGTDRRFSSSGFRDHCQALGHKLCEKCNRSFNDAQALKQHLHNSVAHLKPSKSR